MRCDVKALVSWSGGKDAYMALSRVRGGDGIVVAGLLTTFVDGPDRVAIHEVPADLVRHQADALELALVEVFIPAGATNAQYEAALGEAVSKARDAGVSSLVFGDLHLEDIRAYRDQMSERLGVTPIYPVWGHDTADFARDAIAFGVKAVVCSVDAARLPLHFAGRDFDQAFLADLPSSIDPCGENGEFHTFVYDGPGFRRPVPFRRGAPEQRGWLGCCPLSLA